MQPRTPLHAEPNDRRQADPDKVTARILVLSPVGGGLAQRDHAYEVRAFATGLDG